MRGGRVNSSNYISMNTTIKITKWEMLGLVVGVLVAGVYIGHKEFPVVVENDPLCLFSPAGVSSTNPLGI